MQGPNRERWKELCEMAAVEQDPKKLLELVREINELLEQKQHRLSRKNRSGGSGTGEGTKPIKFAVQWSRRCAMALHLLPYPA